MGNEKVIIFAVIIVAIVGIVGIVLVMNNQYSHLQANYNALNNSYSILLSNYSSLESNYQQLSNSYDSLTQEHASLQSQFDSLQDQYDSLLASYNLLTTEPIITMTDIVTDDAYEQWYIGTQTIGASFNLVNVGQVDGFATVRLFGGGSTWGYNTYFVPAGSSVHKDFNVLVDSLLEFKTQVEITDVFR